MPLPKPGRTQWPPKTLDKVYDAYRVNALWYAGDPRALYDHYVSIHGGLDLADKKYTATDLRRGFFSRVRRTFWGTPPGQTETLTKLHLPLASDIATMSADLLFAEPPKITVENKETQKRLDDLIERGGLHARLLVGGEVQAALGDVYLVTTWDQTLRDHPWLRVVHGDAVVPEWRGDMLAAATIHRIVREEDNGAVWRHLERHEMTGGRAVILNGLYRGNNTELGERYDLREVEELAHLRETTDTGIDRLLVEHIPNMLPNRSDRGSLLGRSDFSPGVISLMDQLDEVWSSLAREFRLAKARAVLTADAVQGQGRGQGATVRIDDEIFLPIPMSPMERPSDPVKLIQPLIRVEEHLTGARALVEEIVRSCGYSLHSFGIGSAEVAATATEIQQRERLSYLTRGKKTLHWARLADAVQTLLKVDQVVFRSKVDPSERPSIEFGDQVAESDAATANTLNLLNTAEAISIKEKVNYLHPDWDDTAKDEEVQRIYRERGIAVPDPEAAFHGPDDVMPAVGQDANAPTPTGVAGLQ